MLETVKNLIPEIYYFCFSAYRQHSTLQFGNCSVIAGMPTTSDPLAMFLFCLAVQELLKSTRSAFTYGYKDAIALGGKVRDIARDVDHIRTEGEDIGLYLNNERCEIIQDPTSPNLHKQVLFISL